MQWGAGTSNYWTFYKCGKGRWNLNEILGNKQLIIINIRGLKIRYIDDIGTSVPEYTTNSDLHTNNTNV